jgi:hypothetical protein
MPGELQLRVDILAEDRDDRELEALSLDLETELRDLDVSVESPTGDIPEGARGEPLLLGTLIVNLGPSALKAVARVINSFLRRSSARSIRMEIGGDVIDVEGLGAADQDRLIQLWLERHTET